MMNLAAKKKKSKEQHRDPGMAGILLKSAARRQQFGNVAHGSLDTEHQPNLARIDTIESAASLAVEFADVIHSIPAMSARNILDLTSDCPNIDAELEMPQMPVLLPQISNGSVFSSPAKELDPMFRLNIGGKSYRFRIDVILTSRMPSLLSSLIKASHDQRLLVVDGYIDETSEYYLERNVRVADHIMDYFITGLLHKPNDICIERFWEELDFWKLKHDQIAPCCSLLNDFPKLKDKEEAVKEFDGVQYAEFRKTLWKLMEDPSSSFFSKIFSFVSIGFIFASVIGLILGSMPEFQEDNSQAQFYHMIYQRKPKINNTNSKFDHEEANLNLTNFVYKPTDNPHHYLIFLEYICITWFTMEYLVRFCVAPRKKKFVMQTMNLIDLCTILPFYLEFVMGFFGIEESELQDISGENKSTFSRRAQSWIGAMMVIRILRVLRMARVFKLARYSQGLQIFGNTLRASMTELSMLSMFLITGTIFFSTVMYFLEKDEPYTDFYSIPAACWWCITTVTTVGYGDTFPISTAGKTVATAASICGIIILAFPISMIVEKFATAQQQALVEDQLRQAQMSAVANDYLLKRFPTRRKACKDSIVASIHKNQRQMLILVFFIFLIVVDCKKKTIFEPDPLFESWKEFSEFERDQIDKNNRNFPIDDRLYSTLKKCGKFQIFGKKMTNNLQPSDFQIYSEIGNLMTFCRVDLFFPKFSNETFEMDFAVEHFKKHCLQSLQTKTKNPSLPKILQIMGANLQIIESHIQHKNLQAWTRHVIHLIEKIENYQKKWKFIVIGPNLLDLKMGQFTHHMAHIILQSIQLINHKLPEKTLIIVVRNSKLTFWKTLSQEFVFCDKIHKLWPTHEGKSEEVWNILEERLKKNYCTEDFCAQVLNFLEDSTPLKSGKTLDISPIDVDCIHFSSRGLALLHAHLWNWLVQPVRQTEWTPLVRPLYCPRPGCPYFVTKINTNFCPQSKRIDPRQESKDLTDFLILSMLLATIILYGLLLVYMACA